MGAIRAVIFDWAGTAVDYGSRAPVAAFVELFRRHGVTLSAAQARGPMGTSKREHIRSLLALEAVADQWRRQNGADSTGSDVDVLYREFIPLQTEVIGRHSDVIPGTAATMAALRARGIRIGSTTGYAREMIQSLVAEAARNGFDPDCAVCADEVPQGRPAPWMALQAAMQLNCYPVCACVKAGDTLADVAEGLNAGMWTVGVTRTGNEIGLSESEVDALPADEAGRRLEKASARLRSAGAHYVIEGIGALPAVVDEIEARLARGERP